jgi:uracil-DNA glycosylase
MKTVVIPPTFGGWRDAARRLITDGVVPADVEWREEAPEAVRMRAPGLFDEARASNSTFRVPRAYLELAGSASSHPDPKRWSVLYAVLYRIAHGEPDLLASPEDPDVKSLRRLAAEARDASPVASPGGAALFVPATDDLDELSRAARACRGCDLYRDATQTVFGQGPKSATAVLVGEQPGDQEDIQGAPFVGPAGAVLDRALTEAGLPRTEVWVTNAVKHFKFVRTPKRRLHQTPNSAEIEACRPWLAEEIRILRPQVLVCLGASASKALLGAQFRITRERGRFLESSWAPKVLATYHPSAVLRAEDPASEARIYNLIVEDLKLAAGAIRRFS